MHASAKALRRSRWVIAARLDQLESLADVVVTEYELSGALELQQDRPISIRCATRSPLANV
jgi:hypothetical protein